MGIVLSVGLLIVSNPIKANDIADLGKKVLWESLKEQAPMPDDLNATTITVASVCGVLGAGLYLGADQISGLAEGQVGQWITKATLNNVGSSDLLRATGLTTGILGGYSLYKDGPTYRRDFLSAVGGNFLLQQVLKPGKIEADEAKKTVLQAFFAITAFKKLAGVIPGTEEYRTRHRR